MPIKKISDANDIATTQGLGVLKDMLSPEALAVLPVEKPLPTPRVMGGVDVRDGTADTRPLSELGNAWRLMDSFGSDIRYIPEAKAWLYWGGGGWAWDPDGVTVRRLAAALPDQIYREGADHLDDAEDFVKWSRASQKIRIRDAAVTFLQDFEEIRLSIVLVDADLFLIGFDNAKQVLDLKIGRGRPALKNDYITKSLKVEVIGDAKLAVRWLAFLTEIFSNDVELIDWLHRVCGYSLTGSVEEQLFIFCFGFGSNGKSVFVSLLQYIFGDYARTVAFETLTEAKRAAGAASPDRAMLRGARFIVCDETSDGVALDEGFIKNATGGAAISARELNKPPIEFTPQFTLWMLGNHKPMIKGTDHGIWRRQRLLPFQRTFKPEEKDPKLLATLKAEAPHILAWMVDGCLGWLQQGLRDTPKTVKKATDDYQADQDLTGRWLSECCGLVVDHETPSTAIYISYKSWCVDNGLRPLSSVRLGRQLGERGFNNRRSNGKTLWAGILVIDSSSPNPNYKQSDWDLNGFGVPD
ncbi:DNA primase family protein [Methylobacter sp.]|uniref:DNA primase family protein n=1 Tax=Methylobacter sp. TaxID=2051955 RepID=UPI002FDD843D